MSEKLHKFILKDYNVRASFMDASELIDQFCMNSSTGALATVVMGRALTSALLLACQAKPGHRICLHFKGDGPLGDIYAEADYEGGCRGYAQNPDATFPADAKNVRLGDAVGRGSLIVTSMKEGQDQPHVGMVELQSGEIGDDVAFYLQQSQQTRSVVSVGTKINDVGRVEAAGGLIIEIMQDVPDDFLEELEARARRATPITDQLLAGVAPSEIVAEYFGDYAFKQLDHHANLHISCTCSMSKIERTIKLLGLGEIEDMIRDGKDLYIRCQFCGSNYTVPMSRLKLLRRSLSR